MGPLSVELLVTVSTVIDLHVILRACQTSPGNVSDLVKLRTLPSFACLLTPGWRPVPDLARLRGTFSVQVLN